MKATLFLALCALLACGAAADASMAGARELLSTRSAKQKAQKCFDIWNKALATKKASVVTARYKRGNKYGVLLPTLSDEIRSTKQGLESYFVDFLKKSPQGKITALYATQRDGYTIASGNYDFTLTTDGKKSVVPARFTYVFNKNCKIIQHHSSEQP